MAPLDLSDNQVASLMAQDARQSTIKYSALGMQALLPKRPSLNAPKANTRFLKNIIRETDSHNAALKAKEAADAKSRLRQLKSSGARAEDESNHAARLLARGDYSRKRSSPHHEEGKPRKQVRRDQELYSVRQRLANGRSRVESKPRKEHHSENEDSVSDRPSSTRRSHHHHRRDHSLQTSSHRSRPEKSRHHRRARSRSPRLSSDHTRHDRSYRRRSPPSSSRSHSPDSDHKHKSRHKPHRKRSRSLSSRSPSPKPDTPSNASTARKVPPAKPSHSTSDSDSDPLAPLLGPPPPAKSQRRGRGTFAASTSAIDTHFNPGYNPAADVCLNSASEDDWDQALEALRDRQRWKQQGADRLRAVGFTAEEVKKWEKGGEKTEADVRWTRSGEAREWDRGKVVDGDGSGESAAVEWGRLKGT